MATYTNIPSSNSTLNRASYTNIPSSSSFAPTDITNLELWLKADAIAGNDGDAVTTWTKSGGASGVSPTQATAARKPVLKTGANGLNSLNVVRFDGTDDYLLGTFDAGSTGITIFIVGRSGATTSAYAVVLGSGGNAGFDNRTASIYWAFAYETGATFGAGWGGATGAVDLGPVTGISTNTPFRHRYKYDKVNWSISGPNSTTPADTSFPTGTFQAYLGVDGTTGAVTSFQGPFKGDMAEIAIYSRALTAGEISQMDTYLLARWGV